MHVTTSRPAPVADRSAASALAALHKTHGSVTAAELVQTVARGVRDSDGKFASTEYATIARWVKEHAGRLTPRAKSAFAVYSRAVRAARAAGHDHLSEVAQANVLSKMKQVASGATKKKPAVPNTPRVDLGGVRVAAPLRAALSRIAANPDGARLLNAAKKNGMRSISVESGLRGWGYSNSYTGEVKIRPDVLRKSQANLLWTLLAEISHQALRGSYNRAGEPVVYAITRRIQRDITGVDLGPRYDAGFYSGTGDNSASLKAQLRRMGINPSPLPRG